MKLKIDLPDLGKNEILYAWNLFANHYSISYEIVDEGEDTLISTGENADIRICSTFLTNLSTFEFDHEKWFSQVPLLMNDNAEPDYLSTIFYMVNSLQERNKDVELDRYNRFPYEASYQHKFNCIEKDLVTEYMESLLQKLNLRDQSEDNALPKIWLTHDIDHIRQGAWAELKYAIKNFKVLSGITALRQLILGINPYDNIVEIQKREKAKGFNSTMFWLTEMTEGQGIQNADYNVKRRFFKEIIIENEKFGGETALHKSTVHQFIQKEAEKLELTEVYTRYHYLKFNLPEAYYKLEDSGVKVDASVGFAGHFGFRNSYSRPFHPYDERSGKQMKLLEVPLHIMDVTFMNYLDKPASESCKAMIKFIEGVRGGTVINILWHNNYLTNGQFKEWNNCYSRFLTYLSEKGYESTTAKAIYKDFSS